MNTYEKIFLAMIIISIIFFMVLCITLIPKQLEFINNCENDCNEKGFNDYETKMLSYPLNNVNGKCYCINKTKIKLEGMK